MSYTIETRPHGALISLAATSREEFVRDLVASLLEAAYGTNAGANGVSGQMVPIQAVGADERALLSNLAAGTLRAIRETGGKLLPPRWLAFDESRVTATLPVTARSGPSPALVPERATLTSPLPDLKATLEIRTANGR
ncbi:MAG: hypothetical protein ACHQPI_12445 [Thermoanaerobaculia bacterium]